MGSAAEIEEFVSSYLENVDSTISLSPPETQLLRALSTSFAFHSLLGVPKENHSDNVVSIRRNPVEMESEKAIVLNFHLVIRQARGELCQLICTCPKECKRCLCYQINASLPHANICCASCSKNKDLSNFADSFRDD